MRHHDEAIARYVDRARHDSSVLGALLAGSVARGHERVDSDIDLILVVTEDEWRAALAAHRIMVVETEGIDYPGGYFDVKLATRSLLEAVAERGDDPARCSLREAEVLFDQGIDLAGTLTGIRRASRIATAGPAASFIAQAQLHGGYFLPEGLRKGDPLLTAHAAVHLATSACRAALALAGAPFPGPKQLLAATRALGDAAGALASAAVVVVQHPSQRAAEQVLERLVTIAGPPLGMDEALSRFVLDNELAWFTNRPAPEYR